MLGEELSPAESTSEGAEAAPREREALLARSAESTQMLLDALHEAGYQRRADPSDSYNPYRRHFTLPPPAAVAAHSPGLVV
jgi:hypothetical protein